MNAGGKAMAALLSDEISTLSTGFSEAVSVAQAGERFDTYPDAPTPKEQGIDAEFVLLLPVAAIAAYGVWYLVQKTLGTYLSPWPAFLNV